MSTETKLILEKLDSIKKDIKLLKFKIVDADLIVTDSDLDALKEAEKDFKSGKTNRL